MINGRSTPGTTTRGRLRRLLPTAGLALAAAVGVSAVAAPAPASATTTATTTPQWGVYTSPGAKNVAGAASFAAFSGGTISRALDFLPTTSWLEMTRNGWLLTPYSGTSYKLMLSVPMLPDTSGVSLDDCAAGAYDSYWTSIGTSLVADNLASTEIRPGWEFNGTWYKWSAAGHVASYVGCYQHLVTAMRSVAGSHFTFTWNPNLGSGAFPAEQAWPGAAYVDDVSVDIYDMSWTWYPTPSTISTAQAQLNTWNYLKGGDHGLNFWASFAASKGKPMGIAEWGVTWRSDGHGGGDDTTFVDGMFDFVTNPANHVVYADYFDSPTTTSTDHQLMGATRFPMAAARFKARVSATGTTAVATAVTATASRTAATPTAAPKPSPKPDVATPSAASAAAKKAAAMKAAASKAAAKKAAAKKAAAKKAAAKKAAAKKAAAKKAAAKKAAAKKAAAKKAAAKKAAAKKKPGKPTRKKAPAPARPRTR